MLKGENLKIIPEDSGERAFIYDVHRNHKEIGYIGYLDFDSPSIVFVEAAYRQYLYYVVVCNWIRDYKGDVNHV